MGNKEKDNLAKENYQRITEGQRVGIVRRFLIKKLISYQIKKKNKLCLKQ